MLQAILFDLDDTLLGNNMETFLPAYFGILSQHADGMLEKKLFLQELLRGTRAMMEDVDPLLTNRDVFWGSFCGRTGLDRVALEPFFERFYREEFGRLRRVTENRPTAVSLVQYAFEQDLQVVIATNPLFPLIAIEQRLEWAGIPVSDYPYALVTAYENMHFAKPHPAYYREILAMIECEPQSALMVGNEWDSDIAPAVAAGIHAYWVCTAGETLPDPDLPLLGHGSLEALHEQLAAGALRV
jgi:FMN phosphatase YigB (HAD superfamily)